MKLTPTSPLPQGGSRIPAWPVILGLLLLAFAAIAQAQQPVPGLKLPITDEPLAIEADEVVWERATNNLKLTGKVTVVHPLYRVEADRAEANLDTKVIKVAGHVRIVAKDGAVIEAEEAELNPDTGLGWMVKARLSIPWQEQRFQFRGESFERVDERTYLIKHGEFTWCACREGEPPDWSVKADSIRADTQGDMQARGATVNLRDHPFLHLPYFRYPMATDRRSGFLPPAIANSSRNGFQFELPYYQTIGPSADATFSPRWMQLRGFDLGGEFRYNLGDDAAGELRGFGIDDQEEQVPRGGVRLIHRSDFGDDFTVAADVAAITDNEVVYDFDHRQLGDDRARALESRLYLAWHRPASMNLTAEFSLFDDLMGGDVRSSPFGADRDPLMVQRLPAVTWTVLTRPLAGPAVFDLQATATNYYREEQDAGSGQLYSLTPRIGLPGRLFGAVDVFSAVGWRQWYAVPNPEYEAETILGGAPVAELTAAAEWERIVSGDQRLWRSSLRPSFIALYAGEPAEPEDRFFRGVMPRRATELVGLSLDSRLFTRSTAGKTRPIVEAARVDLTQVYDFEADEWRDLRLEAELGRPTPWRIDLDVYQSWEEMRLSRVAARVGYDFQTAELSLGYRYDTGDTRPPFADYHFIENEAITAAVVYRPTPRQELTYRTYYSLQYDRMVRQSLEYDYLARQQCWGLNLKLADRIPPNDPEGGHDLSAAVSLRLAAPTPPP